METESNNTPEDTEADTAAATAFFASKQSATAANETENKAGENAEVKATPVEPESNDSTTVTPAADEKQETSQNTSNETSQDEAVPDEAEAEKSFDANYVKHLRSEAASYRTKLKESEDALTIARSEKEAASLEATRYKVALSNGLTPDDISFLHGTEEEMNALALRLRASNSSGTPQQTQNQVGFGLPQGNSNAGFSDPNAAAASFFFN